MARFRSPNTGSTAVQIEMDSEDLEALDRGETVTVVCPVHGVDVIFGREWGGEEEDAITPHLGGMALGRLRRGGTVIYSTADRDFRSESKAALYIVRAEWGLVDHYL